MSKMQAASCLVGFVLGAPALRKRRPPSPAGFAVVVAFLPSLPPAAPAPLHTFTCFLFLSGLFGGFHLVYFFHLLLNLAHTTIQCGQSRPE